MEQKTRKFRRAFTLLDLLIVIAVITIMSAILLPVFSRAREKARRATCQSNLKQLGVAIAQYMQDYDEMFPCGARQPPSAGVGNGWAGQILPYTSSTQLFRCLDEAGRPGVAAPSGTQYYSYRYNIGLVRPENGSIYDNLNYVARASMLNQATRTVLLYEGSSQAFALDRSEINSPAGNGLTSDNAGKALPFGTSMIPVNNWTPAMPIQPYERHSGGANYLCADGHVKWLQQSRVSYGFRAFTNTSAEIVYGGTNSLLAQGTDYTGANRKALTFSYR